ncbi:MAG: type II secretion system F family protein [Pseudomonadota bacterium]
MRFEYMALDTQGRKRQGTLDGDDRTEIVSWLRDQGMYPVRVAPAEADDTLLPDDDARVVLMNLMPVTTTQKVFLFRQLGLMLRSGMSVTEALDVIQSLQKGRLGRVVAKVNEEVKRGTRFSTSVVDHPEAFPPLASHMLRSAEASGELSAALARIADFLERRAALRRQVTSTLMLPVFTLLAAVGVFVFLLVSVLPKFEDFLARAGKAPPPETMAMIDLGNFIAANWVLLLAGILAVVATVALIYQRDWGERAIDGFLLRLPVVGKVMTTAAMSQVSWGLGVLVRSGVPIVDALKIIRGLVSNRVIADAFEAATDSVLRGQDLARSLDRFGIDLLLRQLSSVGERTGNLADIMEEASAYYDVELEQRTRMLANLVEPVAIIGIAGVVFFVYSGFFRALLAVSVR